MSTTKLIVENRNMKRLLSEMLHDMESRVDGMNQAWPGKDVLAALRRNERFVREIREFTSELEHQKPKVEK